MNKELLMILTPTEEEGIFLLTLGYDGRITGYIENSIGNLSSKYNKIFGTNGEVFNLPYRLATVPYDSIDHTLVLNFSEVHQPNLSDTTVYMYIRHPEWGIYKATLYFDIGKRHSSQRNSYIKLSSYALNVPLRIYLGPSPTPPTYL